MSHPGNVVGGRRSQGVWHAPAKLRPTSGRSRGRLKRQIVLPAPGLPGFRGVTKDPTWAPQLLGDGEAMAATAELLQEKATPALAGSVYFSPTSTSGKVYYGSPNLQTEDLTVERTERMLDRLADLARAADRLPAPSSPAQVTTLERLAEGRPYLVAFAFFGCVLTVLGLGALMMAALALLLGRI